MFLVVVCALELPRRALIGAASASFARAAYASVAAPSASSVSSSVPREVARKILQIERLNVDSNSNGPKAKHLPRTKLSGDKIEINVPHDNAPNDFIEYIWLKADETIVAAKKFEPTDTPTLTVRAPSGTLTPYSYCTLHGLWIGDDT